MKNLVTNPCLHCETNPSLKKSSLCTSCSSLPRCEACLIIFDEIATASITNASRCKGCLLFEDNIKLKCFCGKKIPLFFSPDSKSLHFTVRGNFCGECNNLCAHRANAKINKGEPKDYIGYLEILYRQLQMGNISEGQFNDARSRNTHDIINKAIRLRIEEERKIDSSQDEDVDLFID